MKPLEEYAEYLFNKTKEAHGLRGDWKDVKGEAKQFWLNEAEKRIFYINEKDIDDYKKLHTNS